MAEAITINARLADTAHNLTGGDGEMRVIFEVDKASVPLATALFNYVGRPLTVTVKNEQHLPVAIRFRASIPSHKTALGGRRSFKVAFDAPQSERAQTARFFALPDGPLAVEIELGDTTGQPLPEPKRKAKVEDERTPEQRINGKAWSLLLHQRGFGRCPGVWDKLSATGQTDDHEAMKALLGVEHLREIDEQNALHLFPGGNAEGMIRAAWLDARRWWERKQEKANAAGSAN